MAGIGNIYADEICFALGLDPRSRASKLSKKDCEKIVFRTSGSCKEPHTMEGRPFVPIHQV